MGKKSGPAPPDPVATAKAQGQVNQEAAIDQRDLNTINQITPYGNLTYSKTDDPWDEAGYNAAMEKYNSWTPQYGGMMGAAAGNEWSNRGAALQGVQRPLNPRGVAPNKESFGYNPIQSMTATTTLTPDQQTMLDQANQAGIRFGEIGLGQLDKVGGLLSDPIDFSTLGAMPEANEQTRLASSQAILDRLKPQWDQDRSRLETSMANQGIGMGSEAWNRGTDDFNRAQTDARLAADAYGGSEMANVFGLEMANRNARANEMVQQRQLPLNELVALTQGQQVQSPNFISTPQGQINPADLMGATYQSYAAEQQRQQMKNKAIQAGIGAAAGIGGAFLGGPMAGGMMGGGGGGVGGYNLASTPFASGNSIMMR